MRVTINQQTTFIQDLEPKDVFKYASVARSSAEIRFAYGTGLKNEKEIAYYATAELAIGPMVINLTSKTYKCYAGKLPFVDYVGAEEVIL